MLLNQKKYQWSLSNLMGVFKAMLLTKINLADIMEGPIKRTKLIILPAISLFDG
jgi:hypothetical protein